MSQVDDARDWLSDIFPNTGFHSFRELEDPEIWAAIEANYSGGVAQFHIDGLSNLAAARVADGARIASRIVELNRAFDSVSCDPSDTECTINHPWRHSAAHWNKAAEGSK